jgi:pyruvate kinase
MMNRIMRCTEVELRHNLNERLSSQRVHPITAAVTNSAINIAEAIRARLIVIATRSGATAWVKSKSRSLIATLGASEDTATLRRMNLFWGIRPIRATQMEDTPKFIGEICNWGKQHGHLRTGDQVVFVTGGGVMKKAHNVVIVHTVEQNE